MIERILPASVAVVATRGERDALLHPEEEAIVARAVERRRREFITGRACARETLAKLGVPPRPILSGTKGEPLWPTGIIGSITHCEDYRACAVARDTDLLALGIDAEPNEPLPARVLGRIASPPEREMLRALVGEEPEIAWDRLLFSAKEAVFKAWFPLTRRPLGFTQSILRFEIAAGTFTARLCVDVLSPDGEWPNPLRGHWFARDGLVLTAIALEYGAERIAE